MTSHHRQEGEGKANHATHRSLTVVGVTANTEFSADRDQQPPTSLGETDITYVRARDEVQNCIRLSLDMFGVFTQLEVFPFSREVWRAEHRLKGTYHPFTSVRTEKLDAIWVRPVTSLGDDQRPSARSWIDHQLEQQQTICSVEDLRQRIDPMYSSLRTQLDYLLRRPR